MLCLCSYSSSTPSTATTTDFQSATTEGSISPSRTRSNSITTTDEDQQDKPSELNENRFDSEMKTTSTNPSSNLQGSLRSFSWPQALSSEKISKKHHQPTFSTFGSPVSLMSPPQTIVQVGTSGQIPSASPSSTSDKNQSLTSSPSFDHSTVESSPSPSSQARFFVPQLQQPRLSPSAGPVTFAPALLYQVAATGPTLGVLQQQYIPPVLKVLSSSNFNPGAAKALQAGGQPLVFSTSPLTPRVQSIRLSSEPPKEKIESVSEQTKERSRSQSDSTSGYSTHSPVESHMSSNPLTAPRTLASLMLTEMTPQYLELKEFAEEFKTKRIRLGYTQGAVGQSLARKGYNNFAQSTISRFEQMQLSPTNAAAIKLVLEKWLHDTEFPDSQSSSSVSSSTSAIPMNGRKRKKRAVFTAQTRNSLEDHFKQNSKPNRREIDSIANELDLLPEEVRVWFCNKRQKLKQPTHNFQTVHRSSFDQESSLSTSSCADSPPSLFESTKVHGRSPSPPKTPFTIEELSKSSSSMTTSPSQSMCPVNFSSFGMLRPLTTPGLAPVALTSGQPSFASVPPLILANPPTAQTTA